MRNLGLNFGHKKSAGLITISWDRKEKWQSTSVHLFPSREHWMWGMQEDWYDGPIYYLGFAPLLLICWT